MAKKAASKAKTETKETATKEKKVRPAREKKDSYLKDNYVTINDFRDEKGTGVVTKVMHIRSVGTQVREEGYQDGKLVCVSSNFIAGVKIKTKKDWKYLLLDKGPKSKKGSNSTDAEDDDDSSED